MKIIITMLFLATTLTCQAQNILYPDPRNPIGYQPDYYIDSIKIDSTTNNVLSFINPKQIKNITSRGNMIDRNGKVYITLNDRKVSNSLLKDKWLSLQDILNSHVFEAEYRSQVLFIWDNKLLTDTANIRFPAKRITGVTVLKASEMQYFKIAFPHTLILFISTLPPVINIRGAKPK